MQIVAQIERQIVGRHYHRITARGSDDPHRAGIGRVGGGGGGGCECTGTGIDPGGFGGRVGFVGFGSAGGGVPPPVTSWGMRGSGGGEVGSALTGDGTAYGR
jgi:hypothetical protein